MIERVGKFCQRHDQWAENGICPWCPPVAPNPPHDGRGPMTATEVRERTAKHGAELRAAGERANAGVRALLDEKMRELRPMLERLEQSNPLIQDAPYDPGPYCVGCGMKPGSCKPGCKAPLGPNDFQFKTPASPGAAALRDAEQLKKLYPPPPVLKPLAELKHCRCRRLCTTGNDELHELTLDGVLHTLEKCRVPPNPNLPAPRFVQCDCGEVTFDTAVQGRGVQLEGWALNGLHTPQRCRKIGSLGK